MYQRNFVEKIFLQYKTHCENREYFFLVNVSVYTLTTDFDLFLFFRRIVKTIEVHPADRLKPMFDMIKHIESKEHGPCGGFTMMYACMCDYHNVPYREEVDWVSNII